MASLHPSGLCLNPNKHPQTLAQVPSPRLSPQDHFRSGRPGVWGPSAPRFHPPGPVPESVGSPVGWPLHSSAPHPGSRAGSHIRRRCRNCSPMKSSPRRRLRLRPKPARTARGDASPTAGGHATQPPSGEARVRSGAANRLSRELQLPACIAPRQPPPLAYNSRLPSRPSQRPAESFRCRSGRWPPGGARELSNSGWRAAFP